MANDDDYHKSCDNDNREILQLLAEESKDPEISGIINCYVIGQPDKEIRKAMDKSRVPPLKKTAVYLGLSVDGEQAMLKTDIITEIILCIETLLKDLCAIC